MRWLAKILFPKIVEDQENYHRLVNAVYEAKAGLGYEFPTVAVVTRWILNQVDLDREPSIVELSETLRKTIGEDEAGELEERLLAALKFRSDSADSVRH